MSAEQSYYERHREERKAYQRAYYSAHRAELSRKRELRCLLEPEQIEKLRAYQRAYYLRHRAKLLEKKRLRYEATKKGASDASNH